MAEELTVDWQDARRPRPPDGWAAFAAGRGLPVLWSWELVRLAATGARPAVLAGTLRDGGGDGGTVRGLVTARFPGPRAGGRGTIPLAGVVDVDCVLSASLPGVVLSDPELYPAAVEAVRRAVLRAHGRRARALMFRQVSAEQLPAVTRWPAVVREGGPIAVFRNTHADFESYLRGLSKSRRWSLRQCLREIDADPDVTVSFRARGDRPHEVGPREFCALVDRTMNKHHRGRLLPRRPARPEVAAAQLDHPETRLAVYRGAGGRLLAVSMLLGAGRLPIYNAWGALGPAEGGRKGLWFHDNMLKVRWCIENGLDGFVSGQGTIPAKRSMGFETHRQWAVLVPLVHASRRL
ncbi:hypothetical protein Sru01_34560 [Sphaerisporangium rufum]|uniref:Uncharacterized protein n=1 Tax=Sphaerisporangium rufum TaxID=1381558 RepID=A0A919R2F3_9ACTN|nr:hypothetical protein [Sphaerisporangium rufum]GII78474.1 hypothetical protein Sru01_34560 [Sphaerisporangium rufum]